MERGFQSASGLGNPFPRRDLRRRSEEPGPEGAEGTALWGGRPALPRAPENRKEREDETPPPDDYVKWTNEHGPNETPGYGATLQTENPRGEV